MADIIITKLRYYDNLKKDISLNDIYRLLYKFLKIDIDLGFSPDHKFKLIDINAVDRKVIILNIVDRILLPEDKLFTLRGNLDEREK